MTSVAGDDPVRRAGHLGRIQGIFRRRGATWADIGLFLQFLFGERVVPRVGLKSLDPPGRCECRHKSGVHHIALSNLSVNAPGDLLTNHPHLIRPCITIGTADPGKNPGLVVDDLCSRARKFLARKYHISHYWGEKIEPEDDDGDDETEYTPSESGDNLSLSELEYEPDGNGSEDDDGYGPSGPPSQNSAYDMSNIIAEADNVTRVAARDARDHIQTYEREDREISLSTGVGESQGTEPEQARKSTKLRAATLAYLLNFANSPTAFAREWRRMKRGDEDVLHLCGCGICSRSPSGEKLGGCVEKSHLRLGDQVENNKHREWHTVMRSTDDAADYVDLIRISHKDASGLCVGLF